MLFLCPRPLQPHALFRRPRELLAEPERLVDQFVVIREPEQHSSQRNHPTNGMESAALAGFDSEGFEVLRPAVVHQTLPAKVLNDLSASRMVVVKRPDAQFLSVDHVPLRGQESVAQLPNTTPVAGCRRFPASLQVFPNSEIFRLSFGWLCPNAEEILFRLDLLAPLPVWVILKAVEMSALQSSDPAIWNAIARERRRQVEGLELIASENYTSAAVMEAAGTVLTNKYAEGYPGKRYYGGCENVDVIEDIARQRALELFAAEHVNVQPHAGSQANICLLYTSDAADE